MLILVMGTEVISKVELTANFRDLSSAANEIDRLKSSWAYGRISPELNV